MKVLKPGRKQKGWAREVPCSGNGNGGGGCKALLLVEQDDLFQTSKSDMGGDTEYFITFRCQSCGVLTDISLSACPLNPMNLPTQRVWQRSHSPTIWERLDSEK